MIKAFKVLEVTEREFLDRLIEIDREAASKKNEAAKQRADALIKDYGLKKGQIIKHRNEFILIEKLTYAINQLDVIIYARGEKLTKNKKPRKKPVRGLAGIIDKSHFEIVGENQ